MPYSPIRSAATPSSVYFMVSMYTLVYCTLYYPWLKGAAAAFLDAFIGFDGFICMKKKVGYEFESKIEIWSEVPWCFPEKRR